MTSAGQKANNTASLRPVLVHSSMRRGESGARAQSVSSGAVAPSWHYRSFHQAELWWQVHQAHAPRGDAGVLAIYATAAAATARQAGAAVQCVGVAAGGGEKEAQVLAYLGEGNRSVDYLPVDIAVELALRSADAGEALGVTTTPVVGDIAAMDDFASWLACRREGYDSGPADGGGATGGLDTVVTAFGIAPNLQPEVLLPWLRGLLGARGELLVSANLLTSWQEILPQYDNPETARWLEQLLVDWGLASMLTPVEFEVGEIAGVPAVIASARWLGDYDWHFDGRETTVRAGQRLRLFFSLRFTPELFETTCERFGLTVVESFVDPRAGEGVWRVRGSLPAEGPGRHGRAGDSPTQ